MSTPARIALLEDEKEELGGLNQRLAVVITHGRNNNVDQLQQEIITMRVSHARELELRKADYEQELSLVRRALDATAAERAQYQLEAVRERQRADDLESQLRAAQSEIQRLAKELDAAIADKTHAQADATACKRSNKELQKALAAMTDSRDANKNLYQEEQRKFEALQLAQTGLENELTTAREDLLFRTNSHKATVEKLHVEISVLEGKLGSLESDLKGKYDLALSEALHSARERYEEAADIFRQDLRKFYETQLGRLQLDRDAARSDVNKLRAELADLRGLHDAGQAQLHAAQRQLTGLESQVKTLELALDSANRRHAQELGARDKDLARLESTLREKDREYQELMDVRIALDAEIAAYRRLLEAEEGRLGIPPSPRRSMSSKKRQLSDEVSEEPDAKRARVTVSDAVTTLEAVTETPGAVHIDELNLDGLFVKLANVSEAEVTLTKWTLTSRAPDGTEVVFKFPKKYTLAAGESVLIWSQKGDEPDSGNNLKWKDLESICTEANSELILQSGSDLSSHCRLVARQAEIYSPAADPKPCIIM